MCCLYASTWAVAASGVAIESANARAAAARREAERRAKAVPSGRQRLPGGRRAPRVAPRYPRTPARGVPTHVVTKTCYFGAMRGAWPTGLLLLPLPFCAGCFDQTPAPIAPP